jgi:hypothetical protein
LAEDQRLLRCFTLQSKVSSAKATARKRASCIAFSVPKVLSGKRYSLPVWFTVNPTKAMQL